jgi:putative AdoMet-dependent methyltransferase
LSIEANSKGVLDATGFDRWSKAYDKDVQESDKNHQYPFAGYDFIQDRIVALVRASAYSSVLDVGIGTGKLAHRLAALGCKINGIDFSDAMLQTARSLIPSARLIKWDFSKGLPPELGHESFDVTLCNYAIHHLSDQEQKGLIQQMLHRLSQGGQILIADVITETKQQMGEAKQKDLDIWDEDENYLVAEEVRTWFPECQICFEPFSYCSGILVVDPGDVDQE